MRKNLTAILRRGAIVLFSLALGWMGMNAGGMGVPMVSAATASTLPSEPGYSFYVTPLWLDVQSNGHTMAYNQAAAEPVSGDVIAMLDFGRQVSTSAGWQVELDGTTDQEPQSWVKQVAEDFASGWQSDHSQILIEGVGTNNSDYAWSSNSNLWNEAGTDWANLVNTINNQDYAEVAVDGGSDIESWAGTSEFGSWVATGTASVHWCDGYDSVSDPQPMIDYGSEAYVEDSTNWTQQQVYNVA